MKCSTLDLLFTAVFMLGMLIGIVSHDTNFSMYDILLIFILTSLFHIIRKLSMKEVIRHIHK